MTNNLRPDNVKGFSSVNTNTYTASGKIGDGTTDGSVSYNIYHDITAGDDTDDLHTKLTTEKTRLNTNKTQIDELYETHTRKKHFKTSMADRNNAYWRMFMVILLLSIIIVLLYLFRKNFPLVPSSCSGVAEIQKLVVKMNSEILYEDRIVDYQTD